MGYRPVPGGPFFPCWAEGDYLCWQEPCGKVHRYLARLGFTCEPQINIFDGEDGVWVLHHDDLLFVGREQYSWSAFDMSGTLVRYAGIVYEPERLFEIGNYNQYPAWLSLEDRKTIFVHSEDAYFVLNEPWNMTVVDTLTYAAPLMGGSGLMIYTEERGLLDERQIGSWCSPPRLTSAYPRILL